MKRNTPPFENAWALPGRFVREGTESPQTAARTALREKTGLELRDLFNVGVYGDPTRDPRGHTISMAFGSLVVAKNNLPTPGGNATEAQWFPVSDLPQLAFDHAQIVSDARVILAERLRSTPAAMAVMPPQFSVPDLRNLFAAISSAEIDIRNFAANFTRLVEAGVFQPCGREQNVSHRPAKLFRYQAEACEKFIAEGGRFAMSTPLAAKRKRRNAQTV